jgi:hypothetical protein
MLLLTICADIVYNTVNYFRPSKRKEKLNDELIENTRYYHLGPDDVKKIKQLVSRGANDFNKCLQVAVERGHIEVARIMLSSGATNINEVFDIACRSTTNETMLKLLIDYGAGRSGGYSRGFLFACKDGLYETMSFVHKCAVASGGSELDYNQGLYNLCNGSVVSYPSFNDKLQLLISLSVSVDVPVDWSYGLRGAFDNFCDFFTFGKWYSRQYYSSETNYEDAAVDLYTHIISDMVLYGANISDIDFNSIPSLFVYKFVQNKHVKPIYTREYTSVLSYVMPDDLVNTCLNYWSVTSDKRSKFSYVD